MPRALKVCSVPGCPRLTTASRCAEHDHTADLARGGARQRGYGKAHERFRRTVLRRDPQCVLCHSAPSTEADHWPWSRRELVARGLNPNDPQYGRGLCSTCHKQQTAKHQPGGWAAR